MQILVGERAQGPQPVGAEQPALLEGAQRGVVGEQPRQQLGAVQRQRPQPAEVVEPHVVVAGPVRVPERGRVRAGRPRRPAHQPDRRIADPDDTVAEHLGHRLGDHARGVGEVDDPGARGERRDPLGDVQRHRDRPQPVQDTARADRLLAEHALGQRDPFVAYPARRAAHPDRREDEAGAGQRVVQPVRDPYGHRRRMPLRQPRQHLGDHRHPAWIGVVQHHLGDGVRRVVQQCAVDQRHPEAAPAENRQPHGAERTAASGTLAARADTRGASTVSSRRDDLPPAGPAAVPPALDPLAGVRAAGDPPHRRLSHRHGLPGHHLHRPGLRTGPRHRVLGPRHGLQPRRRRQHGHRAGPARPAHLARRRLRRRPLRRVLLGGARTGRGHRPGAVPHRPRLALPGHRLHGVRGRAHDGLARPRGARRPTSPSTASTPRAARRRPAPASPRWYRAGGSPGWAARPAAAAASSRTWAGTTPAAGTRPTSPTSNTARRSCPTRRRRCATPVRTARAPPPASSPTGCRSRWSRWVRRAPTRWTGGPARAPRCPPSPWRRWTPRAPGTSSSPASSPARSPTGRSPTGSPSRG